MGMGILIERYKASTSTELLAVVVVRSKSTWLKEKSVGIRNSSAPWMGDVRESPLPRAHFIAWSTMALGANTIFMHAYVLRLGL